MRSSVICKEWLCVFPHMLVIYRPFFLELFKTVVVCSINSKFLLIHTDDDDPYWAHYICTGKSTLKLSTAIIFTDTFIVMYLFIACIVWLYVVKELWLCLWELWHSVINTAHRHATTPTNTVRVFWLGYTHSLFYAAVQWLGLHDLMS